MEYLILSSVCLVLLAGLVLTWRKGARGNRSDRTSYYTVRPGEGSGRIDDGWWVVVVVTCFLLGATDD